MAECPWGSGPEEPCNTAAADSRLRGPSGGAAGRASLCGVRPQERRLSSRILTLTSGPSLLLSVWTISSRTVGQSHNTKVSALKTQAVFKLWRHSHHSLSDMNFFHSRMENDSIPKPLLLKLNYSRLLIVLALFLSFEVKWEVAPSLTPVSSLLDTGREGDVLGKPNTSALLINLFYVWHSIQHIKINQVSTHN